MNIQASSTISRRLFRVLAPACAAALFASSAHAAFHVWVIQELFTNLDGTVQFVELSSISGGQTMTSGTTIQVKDQANTTTHDFVIPSNLSGNTAGQTFLLATAGFGSLTGGVTPDFTIPNGFLFAAGGTIQYIGANQGLVSFTALPTNGITSHAVPGDTNQVNSPKNLAGQAGSVPEPATWGLIGFGGIGFCLLLRRRATA